MENFHKIKMPLNLFFSSEDHLEMNFTSDGERKLIAKNYYNNLSESIHPLSQRKKLNNFKKGYV